MKITGNGPAAGCQLFYRAMYGYFCSVMPSIFGVALYLSVAASTSKLGLAIQMTQITPRTHEGLQFFFRTEQEALPVVHRYTKVYFSIRKGLYFYYSLNSIHLLRLFRIAVSGLLCQRCCIHLVL